MKHIATRKRLINRLDKPISLEPGESIDIKATVVSKKATVSRLDRIEIRETDTQ